MLHLATDILPLIAARLPTVRLTIVGRSPAPAVLALASLPNVEVTGFVDDLLPYYRRAAVVLVPLRAGGGTRLKILEAMALGRPIVTTPIGCEGLEAEPGRHLLVADTPALLADATIQLLTDPALSHSLAAHARHLVEARYDWPILGRRLATIHQETIARRRPQ